MFERQVMGFRLFDLSSVEDYVANHLRLFILSVAILVIFVGIIAVLVFFIAVRGAEQVMVPEVTSRELTEALLELQVKELYPRISLRYSQTSKDKGLVIEQEPRPGTIVKAGRRIRLVVSQGVIINKVENFIGRNVEDVRMDLLTVYSSPGSVPLFTIKEPMMYEFSAENAGTILAQRPEPGADISGATMLEFVVSRGRDDTSVTVPQLVGTNLSRALDLISGSGINFHFTTKEKGADESGETVVSQNPPANTIIPTSTVVNLTVTAPDKLAENEIFGLFHYTIPVNPYPLAVRLDALLSSGERVRLLTVNYSGGEFTVPYKLPAETILVLYMMNRELYRETIGG